MKILDYRIQTSDSVMGMEDIINQGIELGYQPYGDLKIHYREGSPPIFRQVTVKYAPPMYILEAFDTEEAMENLPHEERVEGLAAHLEKEGAFDTKTPSPSDPFEHE